MHADRVDHADHVDDLDCSKAILSTYEQPAELDGGAGRDALALEAAGLIVHRTDSATSFVRRFQGQRPFFITNNFGRPFDTVFANAALLHVRLSADWLSSEG
jgi:hypothetical protein